MGEKKRWPYCWAVFYSITLISFTAFVLLKTFVVRSAETIQAKNNGIYTAQQQMEIKEVQTDYLQEIDTNSALSGSSNSYEDENMHINIETKRVEDTTVYIADIQISNITYLKTALAENTYGRNIKETTSKMAEENNAILAINGDYYGFRDYGYVLRNGMLYRANYGNSDDEAFVIYEDGSCETVIESQSSAEDLLSKGAVQILSFGPGLIKDGEIAVSENEEVGRAKASNPRTAIGMISPLHYIIVVSDGRTSESEGLTLYELADVMKEAGCIQAYNLDGGGSSTLWFKGDIINNPTDGRKISEREVSDIVYIG